VSLEQKLSCWVVGACDTSTHHCVGQSCFQLCSVTTTSVGPWHVTGAQGQRVTGSYGRSSTIQLQSRSMHTDLEARNFPYRIIVGVLLLTGKVLIAAGIIGECQARLSWSKQNRTMYTVLRSLLLLGSTTQGGMQKETASGNTGEPTPVLDACCAAVQDAVGSRPPVDEGSCASCCACTCSDCVDQADARGHQRGQQDCQDLADAQCKLNTWMGLIIAGIVIWVLGMLLSSLCMLVVVLPE
jgi:hypothetical protein